MLDIFCEAFPMTLCMTFQTSIKALLKRKEMLLLVTPVLCLLLLSSSIATGRQCADDSTPNPTGKILNKNRLYLI